MSINCTRCELCGSAASIYAPGSFIHFTLLLRVIVEPVCILGISLLSIAIVYTKLLHVNARLLLLGITISMIICNIGVLIEALYTIVVSFVIPEDARCDFQVFTPTACYRLRAVYVIGGMGLAVSTILLAIERAVATILFKSYEKIAHAWFGVVLICIQAASGILIYFSLEMPRTLPYCSFELNNGPDTMMTGHFLEGINIAALFVFGILWLINRCRTKTLVDSQLRVLSTRYQLKENISTTRLMIPIMIIFLIMTTSAEIVYKLSLPMITMETVITSNVLRQIEDYAPYSEFQITLMPILTIMMIVLLPMFSVHIKRSFFRLTRIDRFLPETSHHNVDIVTVDEARDLYFEKLQGQWHEKPTIPRSNS
ncbi:unnamed protein product [Auanema sp. JU1783]|nr:unnamed protein product [Auanema sp. JU1783]